MAKLARSTLAQVMADKIDAPGADVSALGQELAAYLLTEGRSGELNSLMRDIMQIRAERGTVEVTVRCANGLSEQVKADITREVQSLFPKAKIIIISEIHDDTMVGGIRLEFANQQLDLSVRAKLNRFKQLTTA